MRQRLPPFAIVLAPLFAASLLAMTGGDFAGCTGSSSPAPLPYDMTTGCVSDDDCVPMGCEVLRCRATRCVEVAPFRDEDGDGHAAPPCGMDCNDTDVQIGPEREELCDLVDQDCDGSVDEMALPRVITRDLTTVDATMAAAAWPTGVLVTDAVSTTGVAVRVVELDGGPPSRAFRVADRTAVALAADAAALSGGGAVIAVASEDGIRVIEVAESADGPRATDEQSIAARPGSTIARIALAPFGSSWVLAWEEVTAVGPDPRSRRILSPLWSSTLDLAPASDLELAALDVMEATDGSVAAVTGAFEISFFAAADGAALGALTSETELGMGRPLARFGGENLVFARDSFDFSLLPFDLAGGFGVPTRLPSSSGGGSLRLTDLGGGRALLTRLPPDGLSGVFGWTLQSDLAVEASLAELSGATAGRSPVGWSAIATPAGTAVITNFGPAGSTLAILGCDS